MFKNVSETNSETLKMTLPEPKAVYNAPAYTQLPILLV